MTIITESFTATGQSSEDGVFGDFSLSIGGTFVGTVTVERSFDDGSTWNIIETFTAVVEQVGLEASFSVKYRFNCTAFTSGTIVARLTQ